MPCCPLPFLSHQEDPKPVQRFGSRGYLNPLQGPASPGALRLADTSLAPPEKAGRWARDSGLGTRDSNLVPFSLDMSHLRHPQQAPSPALPRGVFPCTPALRRYRAGLLRAHPALNRTWAAGSARPAGRREYTSWTQDEGGQLGAGEVARAASPATYARALGKPMDRSTSSADPCLMVPGRCWRFLRGVTLLYSSSLAAMPSGLGWPY